MKVALLSPFMYSIVEPFAGGTEAFLYRLTTALLQRGLEVVCYACEGSNIPGVEIRTCGVPMNALVSQMQKMQKNIYAPIDALLWTAFNDAYNDPTIDLIHNNSFSPVPLHLSTIAQKPVLHTFHLPPEAMSYAAEILQAYHKANCEANCQLQLVTGSEAHAQAWQAYHPVRRAIYCRFETQALPPYGTTQNGRLAFIGRIDPTKGVEDAIAVAVLLGKPLDIFGEPQPPQIPYFEKRVQPLLDKHPNITYHGLVTQEVLREHLRHAQALLFPIKWNEPFGYVTIEAMAMGTPVLMYDRGAAHELIVAGMNGFIVSPDDLQAMAAAVENTRQIDRAACAQYARERYNIHISAEQYHEIYAALV